jgi:hypothetical protein
VTTAELTRVPASVRYADGATLACVLAATLLIIPSKEVVRGIPFSLTVATVVGLIMAVCWFCAQLTTTLGVAKGRTPVRTTAFVFATAMLANYAHANAGYLPGDERGFADHRLVLSLALAGVTVAVCDGVRGKERIDRVLQVVVVSGAIIGLIGALQYVFALDLTEYMNLPGLRSGSLDGAIITRGGGNRVASTTAHPIEFGVICAMMLPLAAHYGFREKEAGRPSLRWWLCAALISTGLVFSVSRSAVLCIGVVTIVLFVGWTGKRRLLATITGVAFLGMMKLASPNLLHTIYGLFANASQDSSVQVRQRRYTQAAQEIAKHFWLGRGDGTWYFPKYNAFDNQYIMSMVETGLIGTLAFIGLFVMAMYTALRARYLSDDPVTRDLGLSLAAALTGPLIGAVTFDLLTFATVTGLSFLLAGIAGALLRETPAQVDDKAWRFSRRLDGFMSRRRAPAPGLAESA